MKKVRIGLVGTGFIADWHYKGFLKNPDAEIMGITRDYYGTADRYQCVADTTINLLLEAALERS